MNHTENKTEKLTKQNLKEIEEKYLIQNSNGTFSLKDSIHNEYDINTVNFLKNNMSTINNLILEGHLKFETQKTDSSIEIVNTKADNDAIKAENNTKHMINSKMLKSAYKLPINVFTDEYCDNFVWHWYGFECDVNVTGTKILKDQFQRMGEIFGFGTLVVTAMGGPLGLGLGLFTLMTIGDSLYQCNVAIDSNNGVHASCFGSPSSASIAGVQSN